MTIRTNKMQDRKHTHLTFNKSTLNINSMYCSNTVSDRNVGDTSSFIIVYLVFVYLFVVVCLFASLLLSWTEKAR